MAKLKITTEQEFLRKISKPVTDFGDRLHCLLDDMRDTLADADGVGLAAVQVGVLYRVCVVRDSGEICELINPEIIAHGKEKISEEMCLSIPEVCMRVKRPQSVTVKAFDRLGKPFTREFRNLASICACHEIDHMDGILFIDRAVTK